MTANHQAREFPNRSVGAGSGQLGLPADIMVAEVSRLLTAPGFLGQSVANLRRADSTFDVLDGLMRSGAPTPSHWPTNRDTEGNGSVTMLYDSVSESLREVGGAVRSFVALRSACALWHTLDSELRTGAPLPEPWQRQR